MSYRINALASEEEAEVMVAADSFDAIVERLQRMVTADRQMILAVREYTYTGRPPKLYGSLRLDIDSYGGGIQTLRRDRDLYWTAKLTSGAGYDGTQHFGFSADVYEHSGNVTEEEAWKRYDEHAAEHTDFFKRRRDMTHIAFSGGLSGRKYQHDDQIVITDWNRDGVATERTLGFEPAEGSW